MFYYTAVRRMTGLDAGKSSSYFAFERDGKSLSDEESEAENPGLWQSR